MGRPLRKLLYECRPDVKIAWRILMAKGKRKVKGLDIYKTN